MPHETRWNEFPQFHTEINGVDLHFLHVASATPVLLTHGWPNSFVEFADLIEHLPAFHVVAPSLARLQLLLRPRPRLGRRPGGPRMGRIDAHTSPPEVARVGPVLGVYTTAGLGIPTEADLDSSERAAFTETMSQDWMNGVDHHALLRTAPQTFAYGTTPPWPHWRGWRRSSRSSTLVGVGWTRS